MRTSWRLGMAAAAALVGASLPLSAAHAAAPTNDAFADAATVSGASGSVTGTLSEATVESAEPNNHPSWNWVSDMYDHSVWFSWVAPAGVGPTSISLTEVASGTDVALGVYTGSSLASLTEVAYNEFAPAQYNWGRSEVRFTPTAGTTYYIGVGDDTGSTFSLDWGEIGAAPANDDAADAVTLPASASGSNWWATPESGEPDFRWGYNGSISDMGGRSVWYVLTPAATSNVVVSLENSDFDTTLGAYTGTLGALSQVVFNDDYYSGNTSRISFVGFAGTTYLIGLGGYGGLYFDNGQPLEWGEVGNYVLTSTVTAIDPPAAPDAPAATPGNAQVALTWGAPANGGSPITGYTVAYKLSSDSTWATTSPSPATQTSLTIGSLTNGSSYDFKVLATNVAGDGSYSAVTTAMPSNTGVAITAVSVTKGNLTMTFDGTGAPLPTLYECSTNGTTWTSCTPPSWTIKAKGAKTVYLRGEVTAAGPWFTAQQTVRQR